LNSGNDDFAVHLVLFETQFDFHYFTVGKIVNCCIAKKRATDWLPAVFTLVFLSEVLAGEPALHYVELIPAFNKNREMIAPSQKKYRPNSTVPRSMREFTFSKKINYRI
jgi:hypothetical protein